MTDYLFFQSRNIIDKYNFKSSLTEFFDNIYIYNERTNLVSRETSQDDLFRIAADCLIPFEFFDKPNGSLFDIGSGAGFPSVILALAFPEIEITAIERKSKKCGFLSIITEKLGLKLTIYNEAIGRGQSLIRIAQFNSGTMKLVKLDRDILTAAQQLVKPGGNFIYYSSPESLDLNIPESVSVRTEYYYLDDRKHLRAVSLFMF